MRPALFNRLLLLGLALVSLQTLSVTAYAKGGRGSAAIPADTPKPLVKIVEGSWQQKPEDAKDSAVDSALGEVLYWMKEQKIGLEWEPDQDYVRKHLLQDLDAKDEEPKPEMTLVNGYKAVQEKRFFDKGVGEMYRVRLQVAVTPDKLKDMAERDREYRAEQRKVLVHERQVGLGKIVLGALAFFAAVAGFFRLNEATKGAYTTWLGVGAVSVVGAVAAALLLF